MDALKSLLLIEFIDERLNPILIGEPGLGKTMLVSGLGVIVLAQGLTVYYASIFHLFYID
ncbi:ATP-binding protein [Thorsellia kenyensis]|uniref:ATP-binding protein n=1 Tax=Thorsellia kenyensis TaxID=1549888 RepID=A0ABV6CAB4_9GAMM